MEIKRLKNGLTVIADKKKGDSMAIEMQVNLGSNDEPENIAGISHFLEHMLFEGTKKRTSRELANEIEKIGGDMNAATDHERTYFYVHIPKNYFEKGVDVIADMFNNSLFEEKLVEKERKVIVNEIKMRDDNPQWYQWRLLKKNLFDKSNTKRPIAGSVESVSNISRNDLIFYFEKYYVPKNLVLSLSGDLPKNYLRIVENYFKNVKNVDLEKKQIRKDELFLKKKKCISEHRDVEHVYYVLGYRAPERDKKESYVLDVISVMLGRGQSSRLFNEVRAKKGLVYQIGSYHDPSINYGIFAVYFNCVKENVKKAKKIVIEQLKFPNLSEQEVNDAKTNIEGSFILDNEDNRERADNNAFWHLAGKTPEKYLEEIKKIELKDVKRVVKKYFNDNYVEIMLEKKK